MIIAGNALIQGQVDETNIGRDYVSQWFLCLKPFKGGKSCSRSYWQSSSVLFGSY